MKRRIRSLGAVAMAQLAICSPVVGQDETEAQAASAPAIGSEIQPCEDCPTFVRVPDAPDGLRPIRYVSKFELTWKNYLKSVDDGTCELPKRTSWGRDNTPILPDDPLVNRLRIDWAISNIGDIEIGCYQNWITRKTGFRPVLPSYLEWEWFARSGVPDRKYPWGDRPDGAMEALEIGLVRDTLRNVENRFDFHPRMRRFMFGTRVGLFPATEWGLHDMLGNVPELTSDVITPVNVDEYNKRLGTNFRPQNRNFRLMKGYRLSSGTKNWKQGIARSNFLGISAISYSTSVGIRFVLIETQTSD
jgi:hypothetical protein